MLHIQCGGIREVGPLPIVDEVQDGCECDTICVSLRHSTSNPPTGIRMRENTRCKPAWRKGSMVPNPQRVRDIVRNYMRHHNRVVKPTQDGGFETFNV